MKIYRKKFDYVDPIKLYSVLREEGSYPFILESRDKHPSKARYTYISADPEFLVKVKRDTKIDNTRVSRESNPFKGLKEVYLNELEDKTPVNIDENERFIGGFLGYIAYDAIHNYIPVTVGHGCDGTTTLENRVYSISLTRSKLATLILSLKEERFRSVSG
ncbi:MAG TPA: hypothetical protein EYP47_01655, partial [Methanococcaceae archaeon]|nr:hypothetical protein [Methanococcaceae archaeon]